VTIRVTKAGSAEKVVLTVAASRQIPVLVYIFYQRKTKETPLAKAVRLKQRDWLATV